MIYTTTSNPEQAPGHEQELTDEQAAAHAEAIREWGNGLYANIPNPDAVEMPNVASALPAKEQAGLGPKGERVMLAADAVLDQQIVTPETTAINDDVESVQQAAHAEVTRLGSGVKPKDEHPDETTIRERAIAEQYQGAVDGKRKEGLGLDSKDQRQITRAAVAGELVSSLSECQDTSVLEKLPARTGMKVGGDISRLIQKYGNADKVPTEELALLGRYLENVDNTEATLSTSHPETQPVVTFNPETGEPVEHSLDDIVLEVMNGNITILEEEGFTVSEDKRNVIMRVNEAFNIAGLDAIGREDHARRIRDHVRQVMGMPKTPSVPDFARV